MSKRVAHIPITSCKDCPFWRERPYRTEDSWERAHDWYCEKVSDSEEKLGMKKIQGYVEWHEEKKIEIPEWCPLTSKHE